MNNSIAVIGGGAAGMAAAIAAARRGASVTLYERNTRLGRKLGITGKGRCNVTNNCTPKEFLSSVTKNEKFLYSAAFRYPPQEIMAFFEELGVPLKTERGARVFPESDKAADVVGALKRELHRCGVRVVTDFRVTEVTHDGESFTVKGENEENLHSAVIICTGGVSYPLTGSTGDGYRMAEAFGIPTLPPKASLVPIETRENVSSLAGLTLKNVTLTVKAGEKVVFSEMGEMLFTHFGVSGPLVLSASCHMRGDVPSYKMEIDLKPAIPEGELDDRLVRLLGESSAKDFINATSHLLPQKLVRLAAAKAKVPERVKAGEVTREMRQRYLNTLKAFPLTPVRFRPIDEAIVTSGGVSVREIDPKTMEAKSVPGLYFAGEVLDVDAYTGGFNLQIAFSTGFSAGDAAGDTAAGRR